MSASREAAVTDLIRKRRYDAAITLIEEDLKERRKNERLRLQLAHVQLLAGRPNKAAEVLGALSDDLAADGFAAKAIAVLKKIQKIEPRPDLEERLARLARERAAPVVHGWLAGEIPSGELMIGVPVGEAATAAPEPAAPEPARAVADEPPILRMPLFGGFSGEEALAVVRGLRLRTYEPGAIIVTEGEPGNSLFVISTGACRVFVRNRSGSNMEVRQLQENEFFGEISLLSKEPRSATVTAAAPSELLELDRPTVDEMTHAHPQVLELLRRSYERRMNSSTAATLRAMENPEE